MLNFTDSAVAQQNSSSETTVTFAELGLNLELLDALGRLGYETPSPIQARTIPVLLEGRDVIGLAQTGTGKTAAFALPALSSIIESRKGKISKAPRILILTPTRELALQVSEAFTSYAAFVEGFTIVPVYGGASYEPQLAALRRGVDVVVGTPGRVIDHIEKGSLDLRELDYVVLDEADEMLRMGFAEDVETILAETPQRKQVALFSATMPAVIRRIGQKYLSNPEEITIRSKVVTGENVSQRYLTVTQFNKLDALTRILEVEEYDGIIVFVRTKQGTEELAEQLRARGFTAQAINGDMAQQQRERAVEALRGGRTDILVATDVAARGLDVERITLVINYDIPMDNESYVHRIGRTGRAGRDGEAILFVTPRQIRLLRSIEKTTRQKISQMQLPSVKSINDARQRKLFERINTVIARTDLEPYSGLVQAYQQEYNVSGDDMAAGLIALLNADKPPFFAEELKDSANGRGRKEDRSRDAGNQSALVSYRISVGHKDRVQPRAIVGAISNEAGIPSHNIGKIDILPTFSLVELPENLSPKQQEILAKVRVANRPLRLERDFGKKNPRNRREAHGEFAQKYGGEKNGKSWNKDRGKPKRKR